MKKESIEKRSEENSKAAKNENERRREMKNVKRRNGIKMSIIMSKKSM